MSLRHRHRLRLAARISTTSMADIVFLLIVFFLLTLRPAPDRTELVLPSTVVRTEVPPGAALISIDAPADGGVVRVSAGREIAMRLVLDEQLDAFVSLVVAANPDRPFVIRADREVPYERIDWVLDTLKRCRARVIFLMSDQGGVASS